MPRKPRSGYTAPILAQHEPRLAARIMPPPQREAMYEGKGKALKRSKSGRDKIDDDTFAAIVRNAIESGRNFDHDQLQSDRLAAWDAYRGEMSELLPPNDNGSKVVSFDVRDMIHAMLPSIERIFMSSDNAIEFVPQRERDTKFCELASKYVAKIIKEELGVVGLRNVALDTALSKVGGVMWWWDESERVETHQFYGLDEVAYAYVQDPGEDAEKVKIEVIEETKRMIPPAREIMEAYESVVAAGQQVPQPQPTPVRDCLIRYTRSTRKLRVEAYPAEQRIADSRATSHGKAQFRGRKMTLKVYELVAMGYDRDECLEYATTDLDTDPDTSIDSASRMPAGINESDEELPDDDYRDVTYCELWIKCDRDGDGIAELKKVCTLGGDYHVVHEEDATQVCLAEFQFLPMPHTTTGRAFADNIADIQVIKTALLRGTMESLPHSIYPRYVGVEGQVNWDDLLSNSPGQPIRVKSIGAAAPFTVDFVGKAAIDVMTYVDDNVREPRTGISKAAQGLDPDALQSTPAVAAASMIGATQSQLEDYALMFGATGFRELYRGLLREIVANQRDPDWMQLNGEWIEIDPRPWNADLDVSIDVRGGTHGAAQKVPVLQSLAAAQQQAMQSLGPDNPLVSLKEIYNVQKRIIELTGVGPVERYWKDPARMPDWKPTPPPTPPDPNAALAAADIEKAKIADDTNRRKIQLEDDRARDKQESDVIFRCYELQAQTGILPPWQEILGVMRQPRPPQTLPAPPNPHDQPQQPPGAPLQLAGPPQTG